MPNAVRGRVFTWLDVVWNVMKVLSLGVGGVLADQVGVAVVYYLGGTLLVCSGIIGLLTLRDTRLADTTSAPA